MAQSDYIKAWRAKNGDKVRASSRAWAKRNRAKCNASVRRWCSANRDHVRAYLKRWQQGHPEAAFAHQLKYLSKNPDRSLFTAFLPLNDCEFEMNMLVDRRTPLDALMEKEEALA